MIQYSPTFIAALDDTVPAAIHIATDNGTITKDRLQFFVATINSATGKLVTRPCDALNPAAYLNLTRKGRNTDIQLTSLKTFRVLAKSCTKTPQEFIVLSINAKGNKNAVTLLEQVYIPIFVVDKSSILLQAQTPSVLGATSKQIIVSPLSCPDPILINTEDTTCSGIVKNITDMPVTMTLISIIKEPSQQASTVYEKPLSSNIMLLPGQEYSYATKYPQTAYLLGENVFAVKAAFIPVTGSEQPYFAETAKNIWYFPMTLIALCSGILVIILAILLRKIFVKLTARKNGTEKGSV